MKLILQKSFVNTLFTIALMIFIGSCAYVYMQIQRLITADNTVVHTHEVIERLDTALLYLVLGENQQSMYFETADKRYLDGFLRAIKNAQKNLEGVNQTIVINPNQLQKVLELYPLMQNHIKADNEVFAVYKTKGKEAAIQLGITGPDQGIIEEIKHRIHDIKNNELLLLDERNTKSLDGAKRTQLLIIYVSLLTGALLFFSVMLLNLQLNERLRAERKRKEVESQLKSIIEGTNDLIAAIDSDMKFITFNQAYKLKFKKIYGKTIEIGMDLRQLLNAGTDEEKFVLQYWERALQGEEFMLTNEFSDNTFYEITFSLIKNNQNEIIGASHIMRNTTNRVLEEIKLKQANEILEHGVEELEIRNREISLLNDMTECLQSCLTAEEAYHPIKSFCNQILPFSNGIVYFMHASHTYLELGLSWGQPVNNEFTFLPESCWALRRNQIHIVEHPETDIICQHAKSASGQLLPYVCIPLMAHNETLGMLYLELPQATLSGTKGNILTDHQRLLLLTTAEHISLALANIRLRETLRYLSVRDPLTGLYNRRYLEETLGREFERAARNELHVAILMIDIDHFKRFNDTYGHDAGDFVLKNVSQAFLNMTRGGDVVCRFGGEEFLIFLYDTSYEAAIVYADRLRKTINELHLQYNEKTMGAISISLGVSVYPDDGKNSKTLIEAADSALYRAKKAGRNRVVTVSHESTES